MYAAIPKLPSRQARPCHDSGGTYIHQALLRLCVCACVCHEVDAPIAVTIVPELGQQIRLLTDRGREGAEVPFEVV